MNCRISSHSGFQALKEVWLGGIYPLSFYNHYNNEIQDLFGKISELTNSDLAERVLTALDIEAPVLWEEAKRRRDNSSSKNQDVD